MHEIEYKNEGEMEKSRMKQARRWETLERGNFLPIRSK